MSLLPVVGTTLSSDNVNIALVMNPVTLLDSILLGKRLLDFRKLVPEDF